MSLLCRVTFCNQGTKVYIWFLWFLDEFCGLRKVSSSFSLCQTNTHKPSHPCMHVSTCVCKKEKESNGSASLICDKYDCKIMYFSKLVAFLCVGFIK